MGKAILELEMPESCRECMFKDCVSKQQTFYRKKYYVEGKDNEVRGE